MTGFIIEKLPYDLSSNAGLALVGRYLKRIHLNAWVDPAFPVRSGIANSDILRSYLGLLCLRKSDFEAVEALRASPFALCALGLAQAPSGATLCQRLEEGVGRPYAGVDGLRPLAAYLGTRGDCLQLALRPGTQHSLGIFFFNVEEHLSADVRRPGLKPAGATCATDATGSGGGRGDVAVLAQHLHPARGVSGNAQGLVV